MLKQTKEKFNNFPTSNKSMIYLMWIYNFWQYIAWLFIWIYIFKINNDISYVINYNLIFFVACYLWFSWIWYIISYMKKSIKNVYYLSYTIMIFSFSILFLLENNIYGAYLFWLIYWIWFWSFWCAVHTNELTNIEDKNRDFYSSMISAWWNIIEIIAPLIVTFIFFITEKNKINWYYILFIIIPIVYLTSFVFIKNTREYVPTKTKKIDINNFYNFKKYLWWQFYMFFYMSNFLNSISIISNNSYIYS